MASINTLTDNKCRIAKSGATPRKMFDGHGLHLYVATSGSKIWRLSYRLDGKAQTATIGPYPLVGLAEARVQRDELRKKILRNEPLKAVAQKSITLKDATAEFLAGRLNVSDKYIANISNGIHQHMAGILQRDVRTLTKDDLMIGLNILNAEQKFVYARRIRMWTGQVLDWAMAQGYCDTNAISLINPKTAFGRRKVKHFASVKLREMPDLMARLDLEKELQSVLAFRMMAYTWVRTGELRMMLWEDIEGDLWRIQGDDMKKGREHLVPLSRQAMDLLVKLKMRCRGSKYVFPSDRRLDRPMSENSVLYLLGRIGYGGLMTGHGLRTIGSTWGNEHGYNRDAIEMALSHSADAKDAVRSAYNQAEYLPQRRVMLQDFADWLEFKDSDQADAGSAQGGQAPATLLAAEVDVGLGQDAGRHPAAQGL